MHEFVAAFLGGVLLGISVVGYLYIHGRIAGISGLIGQVLHPKTTFKIPAIWFLLGLLLVPLFYGTVIETEVEIHSHPLAMILAGLLVGFGTQLGSGCTSGHGICGISRFSFRSITATMIFMFFGALTVYVIEHW